jgi:hypothetical protein
MCDERGVGEKNSRRKNYDVSSTVSVSVRVLKIQAHAANRDDVTVPAPLRVKQGLFSAGFAVSAFNVMGSHDQNAGFYRFSGADPGPTSRIAALTRSGVKGT